MTSSISVAFLITFLAVFSPNISAFHRGMLHNLSVKVARSFSSSGISHSAKKMSKISDVLKDPKWPPEWPYTTRDFRRQDESVDFRFYNQPRFLYHIDDRAVQALTNFYEKSFFDNASVLDICSSWVSHFPTEDKIKLGYTAGIGMNEDELKENKRLQHYTVQDLNNQPEFPYPDNTFDFVTCVVSVDYLNKPLKIFQEIRRVLKPGGQAIISQSNRCFPTKVIDIWLRTNDYEHVFIIGSYFHYATGFTPPESIDISPFPAGFSDPMYIIRANKL